MIRWFCGAMLVVFLGAGVAACGGNKVTGGDNHPPRIVAIFVRPTAVTRLGTAQVTVLASDQDQDRLFYRWTAPAGSFADSSASGTIWTAPDSAGTFTLSVRVSDGADSVSTSADVITGNASLTVHSVPSGATLSLDGKLSGKQTPYTYSPLAPGLHQVRVDHPDYVFSPASFNLDFSDGDDDTVTFTLAPAMTEKLNPGRTDLLEVGGVAFLPTGVGYLYAARTTTDTGIFSAALNPKTGSPNGLRVVSGIRIQEPIGVSPDGRFVIYVDGTRNSLMGAAIYDLNADGVIDSVDVPFVLRSLDTFGPAISTDRRVAYSLSPSEDPEGFPLFWDTFQDSMLSGGTQLATSVFGKLPTWEPGESYLAFVRGEAILTTYVTEGGVAGADTLVAGGTNTAPSWGPWGSHHVAYLHGETGGPLTELRLVTWNAAPVTVHTGLSDPRYVAWSPVQRALLVTHHPAGVPEFLYIFGLPFP